MEPGENKNIVLIGMPRGVAIAPDRTLADLYAERKPLYLKYADQTLATDGLTPDQAVWQTAGSLEKHAVCDCKWRIETFEITKHKYQITNN